jgi:flagellar biosynthesis GTPase FlhF
MSIMKPAMRTSNSSNSLRPSHPGTSARPALSARLAAGGVDVSSLIVIVVVVLAIGVAGFAVFRGNTLKSELTKAQKQATELKAQADDAHAKARASTDQAAQLQSLADQAKADAATAKAAADKAATQAAELKTQVEQARRQAADAKAAEQKAAAELAKLQAQLQAQAQALAQAPTPTTSKPADPTAVAKPVASSLKPLPVKASFKKAPMLEGNALVIESTSATSMSLIVRFSNRTASKDFPVTLEPGAVKEMGWLGAWVLASGDKVEIISAGYETLVKTAP